MRCPQVLNARSFFHKDNAAVLVKSSAQVRMKTGNGVPVKVRGSNPLPATNKIRGLGGSLKPLDLSATRHSLPNALIGAFCLIDRAQPSRRSENLNGHSPDDALDGFPVGFHMGSDQMRLQRIDIRPFLDNDDRIFPDRRLNGDAGGHIDGRAIFDASRFGPYSGEHFSKFCQEFRELTIFKVNRGQDVNHVLTPSNRLMGLAAINLLVGPAVGAQLPFNDPDEQVRRPFLFFAGMTADGAADAGFGHKAVFFRNVFRHHNTSFTDGSLHNAS